MDVYYHPTYANWAFSDDHPTQGRRFSNYINTLLREGIKHDLVSPPIATGEELMLVHSAEYVHETLGDGLSGEWANDRLDLARIAAYFYGGTLDAARRISSGEICRAFNPGGAKHHAQRNYSAGFCVFNDFAGAARHFADNGMRVSILDIDAHHGDGTENLTADMPEVQTISIHNSPLYPGTGLEHKQLQHAFNFPLDHGSGSKELVGALEDSIMLMEGFNPDVIMLAAGADGHELDPLSYLNYTDNDFQYVGEMMNLVSMDLCEGRILVGGAGGYRPDDATPTAWALITEALNEL